MIGTTSAVPVTGASPGAPPEPASPLQRLRAALAPIFPDPAPRRPVGPRMILAAAAGVVGFAVLSLFRIAGAGPFNTIFAEDGMFHLTGALNDSTIDAVLTPTNGYLAIFPRLLAEPATLIPPEWGPALLSVESALVIGALAVFVLVASGAHFRDPAARLLVAAPLVVSPVGESMAATIANNVATLQFYFMYAMVWAFLWSPAGRWGRLAQLLVIGCGALTSPLAVLLAPLGVLRWLVRRDRWTLVQLAFIGAMTLVQVLAIVSGYAPREGLSHPQANPLWGLGLYLSQGVPLPFWGYEWGSPYLWDGNPVLWIVPWAVLIPAVGIVLATRTTRPAWTPAWMFLALSVVFFCVQVMLHGKPEHRYFLAPSILFLCFLAALFTPRDDTTGSWWRVTRTRLPLLVLCVSVFVVSVNDYRQITGRTQGVAWRPLVAEARELCKDPDVGAVAVYPLVYGRIEPHRATRPPEVADFGFPIWLPCSKLR